MSFLNYIYILLFEKVVSMCDTCITVHNIFLMHTSISRYHMLRYNNLLLGYPVISISVLSNLRASIIIKN